MSRPDWYWAPEWAEQERWLIKVGWGGEWGRPTVTLAVERHADDNIEAQGTFELMHGNEGAKWYACEGYLDAGDVPEWVWRKIWSLLYSTPLTPRPIPV
jgi:hypothetical protein